MKCDKCGSPNVVTKIVIQGDKTTEELNLCAVCFQTFVKEHPEIRQGAMGQSLNEFLLGTLNLLTSGMKLKNHSTDTHGHKTRKCPQCSITSERVIKDGVVGCSGCYEFFKDEIRQYIFSLTGNDISRNDKANLTDEQKAAELKKKLDMLLQTENYEMAASVRDEIFKLKSGQEKPLLKQKK
jgi:protein arginine kinase activator